MLDGKVKRIYGDRNGFSVDADTNVRGIAVLIGVIFVASVLFLFGSKKRRAK